MNQSIFDVIQASIKTWSLINLFFFFVGCGVVFGTLEYCFPASKKLKYSRQSKLLDLTYWLVNPLLIKMTTALLLVVTVGVLFYLVGRPLDGHTLDGFGPVSWQPEWLQVIEAVILGDLFGYWIHRWFHESRMWRFHAVHHSSHFLTWMASYRIHPVNDGIGRCFQAIPILLLGFSPRLIEPYIIIIVVYVVFLHSNIRWTWGPLRYVIASPTFHRWHHSSEEEAIDKNYATIFPIWDVLFGTWYHPDHQPIRYGVKDDSVPEHLIGQMLYPFLGR